MHSGDETWSVHSPIWTEQYALHKKKSFSLRIPLVNVNKSAGNYEFNHIYRRNPHS